MQAKPNKSPEKERLKVLLLCDTGQPFPPKLIMPW